MDCLKYSRQAFSCSNSLQLPPEHFYGNLSFLQFHSFKWDGKCRVVRRLRHSFQQKKAPGPFYQKPKDRHCFKTNRSSTNFRKHQSAKAKTREKAFAKRERNTLSKVMYRRLARLAVDCNSRCKKFQRCVETCLKRHAACITLWDNGSVVPI